MKIEIAKSVHLFITCSIITTIISHPGSLYVSSFDDTNNTFYSNITKNSQFKEIESQIKEMGGNILSESLLQGETDRSSIYIVMEKSDKSLLDFQYFYFNSSDKKLPEILEYLKNNSDLVMYEKNREVTN